MSATTERQGVRPRERWARLLLPSAVGALALGLLSLVVGLAGLVGALGAAGSPAPLQLPLRSDATVSARAGEVSYGDGPHVTERTAVRVTEVEASVSGADPMTRFAVRAAPAVWASTEGITAIGIGMTLLRIRRPSVRSAAGPMLLAAGGLAVGSTVAQVCSGYVEVRLGHVAWFGPVGFDGFSGNTGAVFDLTPIIGAAGLLLVVLLIRRAEHPLPPAPVDEVATQ